MWNAPSSPEITLGLVGSADDFVADDLPPPPFGGTPHPGTCPDPPIFPFRSSTCWQIVNQSGFWMKN
jgi:hypothetical protein